MSSLSGSYWLIIFAFRFYETNYKFCQQLLLKTETFEDCHVTRFAAL